MATLLPRLGLARPVGGLCALARSAAPLRDRAAPRWARAKHYSRDIPPNTPRHELDDGSLFIHRNPAPAPLAELPPPLPTRWGRRFSYTKRLSREEVDKMRQMRLEDAVSWTATKLAKKFDVPPTVVMQLAPLGREHPQRKAHVTRQDRAFEHASMVRKATILDRIRRKAKW
ncbi:hypothetical protein DFJ74DRAFT_679232 [Hyaloraphidium curvatum]|nr:hypothetical protein DFJ74DRAFT_679232 [Hyaloraphidium curvatum]